MTAVNGNNHTRVNTALWDPKPDTAKLGSFYTNFTGYNLGDSGVSALLAKRAFSDGKVELVQRRITGEGKWGPFSYLAIKREEERTPKANGEPWVPRIIGPGKGHRS
jgi:hypothetical protein